MKNNIIMGPSGEIALAIPLYAETQEKISDIGDSYVLVLSTQKPIGYALDFGTGNLQLVNSEAVESTCEFLGEL